MRLMTLNQILLRESEIISLLQIGEDFQLALSFEQVCLAGQYSNFRTECISQLL
jgi:hypothetical protein